MDTLQPASSASRPGFRDADGEQEMDMLELLPQGLPDTGEILGKPDVCRCPHEPRLQEKALFGAAIKAFSPFQENASISRGMKWSAGDGGEQRRQKLDKHQHGESVSASWPASNPVLEVIR